MVSSVLAKRRRLLYCPVDDEHYVGFDCGTCFDYECPERALARGLKVRSVVKSRERGRFEFKVRERELFG